MKLLWLCNAAPGVIKEKISGKGRGGLWTDHVLEGLRAQPDLQIRVLCPDSGAEGTLDEACSFRTFRSRLPHEYMPELEETFAAELSAFCPDVIHIWGTEYAHSLALVNAAEKTGFLEKVVISIQGLCSVYAGHYAEGLPWRVIQGATFRDVVRRDNIDQQRRKFALRGENEVKALKKAGHVIGRTAWDKACAGQINPVAEYHFCNETLRRPFFEDQWSYAACRKHRIFASSCVYPVKGFHYLLEALAEVVKRYPDVTVAVPGSSYLTVSPLRRSSYQAYLADLTKKYGLEDKIEFLGSLSAEGMKEAFLAANVFVMPSTIENSPNSLGEAMILGMPAISADVGGVTTMMNHGTEGYVYQSTAPYMLAYYIEEVFAMEEAAEAMGQAARAHALKNHDPAVNLETLLNIYHEIGK